MRYRRSGRRAPVHRQLTNDHEPTKLRPRGSGGRPRRASVPRGTLPCHADPRCPGSRDRCARRPRATGVAVRIAASAPGAADVTETCTSRPGATCSSRVATSADDLAPPGPGAEDRRRWRGRTCWFPRTSRPEAKTPTSATNSLFQASGARPSVFRWHGTGHGRRSASHPGLHGAARRPARWSRPRFAGLSPRRPSASTSSREHQWLPGDPGSFSRGSRQVGPRGRAAHARGSRQLARAVELHTLAGRVRRLAGGLWRMEICPQRSRGGDADLTLPRRWVYCLRTTDGQPQAT